MNTAKIDNTLLKQVVDSFERETGLCLAVLQEEADIDGCHVDAIVQAPHHSGKLAVVIKKWAPQANIGVLASLVNALPIKGVLVADYINAQMAKKLKDLNVQFIDAVGNAYINQPPIYILATGNKQQHQTAKRAGANRAFNASGLKVVFGLLCDDALIQASYRTIAEQTDVSLGTAGKVMGDLMAANFIVDRGDKGRRRWVKRRKLLDRWVEAYPEKLKPKLWVGEFASSDPSWWETIDIEQYDGYWGGEIAAVKYSAYLKPQTATIYLPESEYVSLLTQAKLRKTVNPLADVAGLVSIYRPFWPEAADYQRGGTAMGGVVNPILTYADLISSGESRNLEAAGMLYEQYIAQHIGED